MKYFNKVNSERLYLSPINPDDYEICTKWINEEEIGKNTGSASKMYSLVSEKEALIEMSKSVYHFAIVLKDTNRLIGTCDFQKHNPMQRHAEVGIFIGEEADRNKGYGTEALAALVSHGFEVLNLNNIMLKVFSFNERAIKSYEKVGFKKIGQRRKNYFYRGEYYDDVFMDILAEEYWSSK